MKKLLEKYWFTLIYNLRLAKFYSMANVNLLFQGSNWSEESREWQAIQIERNYENIFKFQNSAWQFFFFFSPKNSFYLFGWNNWNWNPSFWFAMKTFAKLHYHTVASKREKKKWKRIFFHLIDISVIIYEVSISIHIDLYKDIYIVIWDEQIINNDKNQCFFQYLFFPISLILLTLSCSIKNIICFVILIKAYI